MTAPRKMTRPYPKFSELPLNPASDPLHSAWGLWGPSDELGTLNHLTSERTILAAREVKTGTRIGLNWSLHEMSYTGGFRETLKHEIFSIGENMNDDRVSFNTQTSSQWDGFRHWGFDDGRFYNGFTQKEILENRSGKLGIQAWEKEGIVGRGVLIDFVEFAKKEGIEYDPLGHYAVSLDTVKAIAHRANVTFQPGDIILLRTGFTSAYSSASLQQKKSIMSKSPFRYPGIEATLETLEWLWENQFAAVASDCPGFEAWPPSGVDGLTKGMHPILLAGFGMPIGELFDLEGLSKECARLGRSEFMFVSQVMKVDGGVGSPPNAVAIF